MSERSLEQNALRLFEELERVERERDAFREAVEDFARLNCAKPPMGKLYSDPVYCGTCTSCRARSLLKQFA